MRVGVVFGGRSVEHDVSVVTAHQAMEALSTRHEVVPIYVTRGGAWFAGSGLFDLDVYRRSRWADAGEEAFVPPVTGYGGLMVPGGRLKKGRRIPLDIAVCAVHGTYGEDGTLQGLLELAALPYTGCGVAASAIGLDKVAMKAAFRGAGLPVVDDIFVEGDEIDEVDRIAAEVESRFGYPIFIKPARAGSSVGIARVRDREGLFDALEVARRYDRRLLIERAMEGCVEINCSVLGGVGHEPQPSACEQPVGWEEFLTFSDKYLRGGKSGKSAGMVTQERLLPAPIGDGATQKIQSQAVGAFRAINGSGVARIDSFFDPRTGETWVMEINTMPGSFAFYLWETSGLAFPDLMDRLLDIGMSEHRARGELMFTFESGMLDADRGMKVGGGKST